MTIDPQAQLVLDIAKEKNLPAIDTLSASDGKAAYEARAQALAGEEIAVGKVQDIVIPGILGNIPARLYQPENQPDNCPILVYFHGGGWVVGNPDTHDKLCREVCKKGEFIVLSVDYRMGPDEPFPAAVIDCHDALNWAVDNIAAYEGDASRIAVGGDSAGGNLSAVTCLMALEQKSYMPVFQWLIYPATNMHMESQSHKDLAEGYFLTRDLMEWFQGHYLQSDADKGDWRASPSKANTFKGLPPALLTTAGFDPLKDEGAFYAEQLQADGVEVTYTHYEGMLHGFMNLGGVIDMAHTAIDEGVAALNKAFKG
jgi:acetyl esterase/lipase